MTRSLHHRTLIHRDERKIIMTRDPSANKHGIILIYSINVRRVYFFILISRTLKIVSDNIAKRAGKNVRYVYAKYSQFISFGGRLFCRKSSIDIILSRHIHQITLLLKFIEIKRALCIVIQHHFCSHLDYQIAVIFSALDFSANYYFLVDTNDFRDNSRARSRADSSERQFEVVRSHSRSRFVPVRVRRGSPYVSQTGSTAYWCVTRINRPAPPLLFLLFRSYVVTPRNLIFRSIDLTFPRIRAQSIDFGQPSTGRSFIFVEVRLTPLSLSLSLSEIISREREQSSINGIAARNLTVQRTRNCSPLTSWSGSDESRSTPRTDLKGLDQGRRSEGRVVRTREWDARRGRERSSVSRVYGRELTSPQRRRDEKA